MGSIITEASTLPHAVHAPLTAKERGATNHCPMWSTPAA